MDAKQPCSGDDSTHGDGSYGKPRITSTYISLHGRQFQRHNTGGSQSQWTVCYVACTHKACYTARRSMQLVLAVCSIAYTLASVVVIMLETSTSTFFEVSDTKQLPQYAF
eukprot:TRINITY_DN25283_c0_g1_i1.p2 TRINITY_DN25283_c0_g1~~TRINITY_DN25283_c0_g1_i1.p2  ORF type:complete len:110 (+),score=5.55 TRINITY_DN25283_c0_g1_i1:556-885(+)